MSHHLISQLKGLKLHGMAQTYPDLLALEKHSELTLEQVLKHLIAAETSDRAVRVNDTLKLSHFPRRMFKRRGVKVSHC